MISRMRRQLAIGVALAMALAGTCACTKPGPRGDDADRLREAAAAEPGHNSGSRGSAGARAPGDRLARRGEEIVVCGELVHVGAPVVTWLDPGGYDAYRPYRWFDPAEVLPRKPVAGCDTPSRLSAGRTVSAPGGSRVPRPEEWTLAALQERVHQFVVHYDVAWTSANCFRVLHDLRGLSVHFMLDLDGTIYQTCDLKERARHGGAANDASVGIEIAHPGPLTGQEKLAAAYKRDGDGVWLQVPERLGLPRTPGFKARPARPDPIVGTVNGSRLEQYDFTEAQYRSLGKLLAALHRTFPRIRLEAPRAADGAVDPDVLPPDALAAFEGVIGHWHITKRKVDPGPAFQWERMLGDARRHLAEGVDR
jgi:N-acetyl-anhydromuramyl-L-alanine amidase AmpD